MSTNVIGNKNIIDVIKYRWIWLILSLILILPGIGAMIYSMVTLPTHTPVKVGIDFTGGTVLQYGVKSDVNNENISKLRDTLAEKNIDSAAIQIINVNNASDVSNPDSKAGIQHIISIRTKFIDEKDEATLSKVATSIKADYPEAEMISITSVGPTLGKELYKNSLVAMGLAFIGIVAYLTMRFRLDYAVIALLSLFHDVLFVVGVFSILGLVYNVEIDSLFITATLTVIGFSVHDTIVVFDRVRENMRFLAKKASFDEIVNASVNQTLARSVNTSFTTLITLLALYFFGGVTTKDFVLAMILGIAIGTYSSIFFASMILAWHRDWEDSKKGKSKPQLEATV